MSVNPEVIVYSSESRLRRPAEFFLKIGKDLLASREPAWRLFVRDIRAQYRLSFLGVLWVVLPGILAAAGLSMADAAGIIRVNASGVLPYPVYVFFGMTLWQIFAGSVQLPASAVSAARPILSRINLPPEAAVLSKLIGLFFNFSVNLVVVVALFIWLGVPVGWKTVLAFLAALDLVVFGLFVGFVTLPFTVLSEDFSRVWKMVLGGWFFLTPVVYAAPDGLFGRFVKWNPAAVLIDAVRNFAVGGAVGDPAAFWIVSAAGCAGFLAGWALVRLAIPYIIECGGS